MIGLTHGGVPGEPPVHEKRVVKGKYAPTSGIRHGSYNHDYQDGFQGAAVLQSASMGNGIGYPSGEESRLEEPDEKQGTSAAGYDLQGIGGQPIHDTAETKPGPVVRDELPLMSHPGYDEKESDYGHPGESPTNDQKFRYRQRYDGV
jgi:hypothetical protein